MINLLPPSEKTKVLEEQNQRVFSILVTILSVFFVAVSLLALLVMVQAGGRTAGFRLLLDAAERELSLPDSEKLIKEIESYNKNIIKIHAFFKNQPDLSHILQRLAYSQPLGLYLTGFNYKKDTLQVDMAGFSPTREALFSFKENLEKEAGFKEVYFPPANWIKPTDINFRASFKIMPTP